MVAPPIMPQLSVKHSKRSMDTQGILIQPFWRMDEVFT